MKTTQDILLYNISIVESDEGNFLKISCFNSASDRSAFHFSLPSGKIAHSHIETDIRADKEVYDELVKDPEITLPKFLEGCMGNDTMIGYTVK